MVFAAFGKGNYKFTWYLQHFRAITPHVVGHLLYFAANYNLSFSMVFAAFWSSDLSF
jgi:hypothetical protein